MLVTTDGGEIEGPKLGVRGWGLGGPGAEAWTWDVGVLRRHKNKRGD